MARAACGCARADQLLACLRTDEGAGADVREEAAMALAELYADSGRPADALEVLRASSPVQAAPAPPAPGTPAHADALALLHRRANLLLSLGQQAR